MRACIILLSISVACGSNGEDVPVQTAERRMPRFDDYPVGETYQGPLAEVDLSTHEDARRYRTVIRAGAESGPNFAGHYTLVNWGCGSPCQMWAIIDAQSGSVFMPDVRTSLGAEYRVDSRLFVANKPELVKDWCSGQAIVRPDVRYYVWEDERLTFVDSLVVCR
jgi:hypothetical protein